MHKLWILPYLLSFRSHCLDIQPSLWYDMQDIKEDNVYPKLPSDASNTAVINAGVTVLNNVNNRRSVLHFDASLTSGFVLSKPTAICFMNDNDCEFTVAFWVKWENSFDNYVILSQKLRMHRMTQDLFSLQVKVGESVVALYHTKTKNVIGWQFYSIVWDNHCLLLYVDGVRKKSKCSQQSFDLIEAPKNGNEFVIGKTDSDDKSVKMFFDELMIWNEALNEINTRRTYNEVKEVWVDNAAFMSTVENKDGYLSGYTIMDYITTSPVQCMTHCIKTPLCCSFNYKYTGYKHVCELNSKRKHESEEWKFEHQLDSFYYERIY